MVGRNQVINAIQQRYAEAKIKLGPGAADQANVPRSLAAVMTSRISVEDARRLGEMTEAELIQTGS